MKFVDEATIDVAAGTGSRLLDYIERASAIHVTAADYLSTGQLPRSGQAVVAVPARWSFEDAPRDARALAAS